MENGSLLNILFDTDRFMPHGYCFLWQPDLLWLHVIADATIAIAYFSIPLTIGYIIYKQKQALPFRWAFVMFAMFIFLCGTTHLLEIVTLWRPVYYFEGVLKILTAAVSIATAILMFPLIPSLLHLLRDIDKAADENDANEERTKVKSGK